jgi:hypothetical protein
VSFEDSTGAVVQEISMVDPSQDTLAHAPGAPVLDGTWKGEKLQATRPGPGGGKVTQTFRLKDKGNSLEIDTKIEPPGNRPSRTFKRVYLRVNA